MSVYEASITNPKKQLEFYKDLSEQLQQKNKELENINDKFNGALNSAEKRIDKAIEYIEDYKDQWCRNDEVISDMNELLSILKGKNNENN